MSNAWLYPFIFVAGLLQAAGASMNGQLNRSLANPWLASSVSFVMVLFVYLALLMMMPRPLPTSAALAEMPWWAPLGGVTGAVAVFAGLMFVQKVGSGALNSLTITANIIASLVIDHYALFNMPQHAMSPLRFVGALLMIGGIALIARF
jgi:transporter family-2 protein